MGKKNEQDHTDQHLPEPVENHDQQTDDNGEEEFDYSDFLNPARFPESFKKEIETEKAEYERRRKHCGSRFVPRFEDPVLLQEAIDDYFKTCDESGDPYTVPGLAYHLGFTDKSAVYWYAKKKKDTCGRVMRSAYLKIEDQRNKQAVTGQGQQAGRIFDLKCNFGWDEKAHEKEKEREAADSTNPAVAAPGSVHLHLPPTPKSMEEWMQWYDSYQKQKAGQMVEGSSGQTIDVKPQQEPVKQKAKSKKNAG